MRRFLLILTVLSFSGWSQPGQQKAQPPTVVKVEMPPESIWTALLRIAIPAILAGAVGAGLTLYGVRQTNRHNAAENAANRQHELEKLNRDHSLVLKRDVLLHVTQLLVQTLAAVRRWDYCRGHLEWLKSNPAAEDDGVKQADSDQWRAWNEYSLRRNELEQATAAACLAVSDDLWKLAQSVGSSIAEAFEQTGNRQSLRSRTVAQVDVEIANFIKAARAELGFVPHAE
jgi:hypothetical protein